LQTKKRYVGYKYETKDQVDPVYEAKGIETVRRDGCPAVVKILERSLRVLFDSKDVSRVKSYVQRQFSKIQSNRANIQEFIFAKFKSFSPIFWLFPVFINFFKFYSKIYLKFFSLIMFFQEFKKNVVFSGIFLIFSNFMNFLSKF